MSRRHHVALLLLAACVPSALDETGKRCSDERPCGRDFICVAQTCQDVTFDAGLPGPDAGEADAGLDAGEVDAGAADAGALDAGEDDAGLPDAGLPDAGELDSGYPFDTQLLANPGFESLTADGGVRSWRATTGSLSGGVPGRSGQSAARITNTTNASPAMQSDLVAGQTSFGMLFCAEAWVRHELDAGPSVTLIIRDRYFDGGIDSSNGASATIQRGAWRVLRERWQSYGGGAIDVRVTSSRLDPDASVLIDDMKLFRQQGTTCVFP